MLQGENGKERSKFWQTRSEAEAYVGGMCGDFVCIGQIDGRLPMTHAEGEYFPVVAVKSIHRQGHL